MKQREYTAEREAKTRAALEVLQRVADEFSPATMANSFGAEDMVLMDLICRNNLDLEIFSLDTGRLNEETYGLMDKAQEHYRRGIKVFFPDAGQIEEFVRKEGINPFYRSVEMRKACCGIRKVEPLKRALDGKAAWITGLRREQAVTRAELPVQEHDEGHGLEKFNPLVDWTEADVWAYIQHFDVPYNELHDKGYPSIGCAPCTRAITVGEDIRAGRWWWENPELKECGLHVGGPSQPLPQSRTG